MLGLEVCHLAGEGAAGATGVCRHTAGQKISICVVKSALHLTAYITRAHTGWTGGVGYRLRRSG